MNKTVTGAILIFILIVIVSAGVKFISPIIEQSRQKSTSDAAKTKGKIRIDIDNWIGYFPLCSAEMKNLMRKSGYTLQCREDNADYQLRMKRLAEQKIDFAVATVDSYILNGAAERFPGTVILVIDESKGGDAIIARKDKINSLDSIKNRQDIKVAFTPDSPSHHLAKAASDHFGLKSLLPAGKYRIETDGSKDACDKLLSGETDVAICWEPDVSRAINKKGIVKLLGTEDARRLIVDILLVNRDFAAKETEAVYTLIKTYFKVLDKYSDNPDILENHLGQKTGIKADTIQSMLKGVKWIDFNENCVKWFGISGSKESEQGLVQTIESTVSILVNAGDFTKSPLPDDDPYRLTNSSFLESIFKNHFAGFIKPGKEKKERFSKLDKKTWLTLKPVGTLKIEPISFRRGSWELDLLGKEVLDRLAGKLKHYPNFRIMIKAHTGIKGDPKANMFLSQKRADSAAQYLITKHLIDSNRTFAIGFGGKNPLKQDAGESKRSWMYRLPRVEVSLVRDMF